VAEGTVANLLIAGMTIYGPVTLGLAMLLGTMGIPVPLPILALAAGAFARYGSIKAGMAVFAALAGATLGDSLGYVVGRFASEWAQTRYGESAAWHRARNRFHRNGDLAIFITRFLLTPLAVPTNLIAGISHYPYRRFLIYTVGGTLVFLVFFGGLGYAFSRHWQVVGDFVTRYFEWIIGLTIAGVVIFLLVHFLVPGKGSHAEGQTTPEAED
jgi:membrane-associated protein